MSALAMNSESLLCRSSARAFASWLGPAASSSLGDSGERLLTSARGGLGRLRAPTLLLANCIAPACRLLLCEGLAHLGGARGATRGAQSSSGLAVARTRF